jgi:hypothetical protein
VDPGEREVHALQRAQRPRLRRSGPVAQGLDQLVGGLVPLPPLADAAMDDLLQAIADLASVQLAEHLKDDRDLAVRGPLGPPLAGAVQERPEVTVARVLEGEAVQEPAVRANERNVSNDLTRRGCAYRGRGVCSQGSTRAPTSAVGVGLLGRHRGGQSEGSGEDRQSWPACSSRQPGRSLPRCAPPLRESGRP